MTLEQGKHIVDIISGAMTVAGIIVGGVLAYRFYFMESVVLTTTVRHAERGDHVQLAVDFNIQNVGNTKIEGRSATVVVHPLFNDGELPDQTQDRTLNEGDPTHLYLIDKGEVTALSFLFKIPFRDGRAPQACLITSSYASQQLLDQENHYLTWTREDSHLVTVENSAVKAPPTNSG